MTQLLMRAPKDPFDVHSAASTLDLNLVAGNSGNLLFIESAWKLVSAPGVEVTPDRLAVRERDADEINERYDAYVIPLANAFRTAFEGTLVRMTALVRRLRIPVIVVGVGAQGTVDYRWDAIRPMDRTVRDFVAAVLERSPAIGVRGEATQAYLNGLGFRDVEVIGCPSMFLWGDGLRIERRVRALDASSNVAVTISPYRPRMGEIAMTAYARFPRLTYIAQDAPTLALLLEGTPLQGGTPASRLPVHPAHPFFRDDRARYYLDPWPWIDDLRGQDFCFGSRIHGTIAALLAGTPATVLAHDSRTLELARYFDIPHRRLAEVSPTVDPGELYEAADFTALQAGHAARFATLVGFMQRAGLDHAFAHPGAAEAFDQHVARTAFPGAVTSGDGLRAARLRNPVRRLRSGARRVLAGRRGRRLLAR
jgi:hypothetical protein